MNLNITLEQPDKKLALFGSADRYLRLIRDTFGVQLVSRDDQLRISGDSATPVKWDGRFDDANLMLRFTGCRPTPAMSNNERQQQFRNRHPGYYARLQAERRASAKRGAQQWLASMRQAMGAVPPQTENAMSPPADTSNATLLHTPASATIPTQS